MALSILWYKLKQDLWGNKARTARIVSIVAMGALAVGMIATVRGLIIPNMQKGWQAINPAMINLAVFPYFNDDDLLAMSRVPGITDAEARATQTIEWRIDPNDEWRSGQLNARQDYNDQRLNSLMLIDGDLPDGKLMALEQGSEDVFGIPEGSQVYLKIGDKEITVQTVGIIYNQLSPPPSFGGTPQFYTTMENYHNLTDTEGYNFLMATAAEYDEEAVTVMADEIEDKLAKVGKEAFGAGPGPSQGRLLDPDKHFFQDSLDGLLYILGIIGLLALMLGLLLVYTTINALIAQQTDQIGIMKAVGAGTGQILKHYLTLSFIYGLIALFIAVPLGMWGGWLITDWLIRSFNATPDPFTPYYPAIWLMVAITLIAPVGAALVPIINGARITVREAISAYGLNAKVGLIERLLAQTKRISRIVLVTITNTFRNRWRVIQMQITLVLSGLIFMMVVSLYDSVVYTFNDVLFSILNYDINYVLDNNERIEQLETLTLAHPDVAAAEMWGFDNVTIRPAGMEAGDDDPAGMAFGVPLPTDLYGYQMRAGRWLLPEDTHGVVLNQELAEEVGVGVGDWITVKHGNQRDVDWQVVGLLFDPLFTMSMHAPRETLLKEIGSQNRAATIWLQTHNNTLAQNQETATDLRRYYADHQVDISPQRGVFGISDTATETAQAIINQFNFIVVLMSIMAILIASVGSIALSGALSLSVLERHREIGVMRAIGATSGVIARMFIGEGLILGWMSWLIALPLSLPAGKLLLVGMSAAFQLDLIYRFTPNGAVLWLVIITVLSILASWLPTRNAVRVSVRESLAYQ